MRTSRRSGRHASGDAGTRQATPVPRGARTPLRRMLARGCSVPLAAASGSPGCARSPNTAGVTGDAYSRTPSGWPGPRIIRGARRRPPGRIIPAAAVGVVVTGAPEVRCADRDGASRAASRAEARPPVTGRPAFHTATGASSILTRQRATYQAPRSEGATRDATARVRPPARCRPRSTGRPAGCRTAGVTSSVQPGGRSSAR